MTNAPPPNRASHPGKGESMCLRLALISCLAVMVLAMPARAQYTTVPTATTAVSGKVKPDGTSITISNGTISAAAGGSVIYPPGSTGAQPWLDAQKAGQAPPAGVRINTDGSVEVGNINVPPEVVHQRYAALDKLAEEAEAARIGHNTSPKI